MNKSCENILVCYVAPIVGLVIIILSFGAISCITFFTKFKKKEYKMEEVKDG